MSEVWKRECAALVCPSCVGLELMSKVCVRWVGASFSAQLLSPDRQLKFHIGSPDEHNCAILVSSSHWLELVSKGCVRWAPFTPASPPNCCPRTARCLSDGTCHYKGVVRPHTTSPLGGLELVSKDCVRWAPSPPATPPNCCPRTARCLSDGTCHYKGVAIFLSLAGAGVQGLHALGFPTSFSAQLLPRTARCLSDGTCHYKGVAVPNWSEVPISLTGCEERCFCENGELDCQEVCSPLPAIPPQTLRCPPNHRPAAVNISDEDCCKHWGCLPNTGQPMPGDAPNQSFLPTIPPEIHFPQDENIPDYDQNNIHRPQHSADPPALAGLPPGLTLPPGYGDMNKKLTVISLQADSPTSVKMLFGLPAVLVGLRGSVDLRYTDKADEDVSHWYSQVFAPADEVLTTPRLEFRLTGLTPATTYKIRGKLYLHNLPVEPESEIYTVRTLDVKPPTPTLEEKRKEIDSRLTIMDVNDTAAHVTWRRFGEDELQFIDAIQVRYRPVGTPIYSMTELLHHSRSSAELHDLRPGSRYEASLVLVPPPKATTELTDPGRIEFDTAPYVDPYNWTVTIEARSVGSSAAEVWWRGIPAPAERWVRVYRGAHACGARREQDEFRLATRDLPPAITLTGLQPNTKCRVWLEMFLTNGKVKTSNVLEINTKSEDSPEPIDNEIEASSVAGRHRGDYYGALVGVGAVAALGALTSLLLLLVLLRRHRPRSVPITSKYSSSVAGRHRGDYYGALGALTSLLLLLVLLRRHRPRSVPITSKYSSSVAGRHRGDYYGALVGALTSLLLLLVLLRRHRPRSVPITSKYSSSVAGRHRGDYYGALGALTSLLLLLVLLRRHRPRSVPITSKYSSSVAGRHRGDYYGALVGVGAVAALGALTSLLLLLVLLRRHRPRSVPITTVPSAPRESSLPPYDNPAYKLELQQETMDL
ncbi:hypothetical protein PYW07_008045 [Mythimna separata]|uniref:Fibronectin type-III domain-containing protein n=1 Tax=Mythimna separata TaxID=271217 RepID=A0AAD7YQA8_MYTSE|nr:hypothetical protein PYW07_008045 [Mythimna separata]